jgi:uncharacterized protein YfbU (UPF0304 family)
VNVMPKAKDQKKEERKKEVNVMFKTLQDLNYELLILEALKKEQEKLEKEIKVYQKLIEIFDIILAEKETQETKKEVKEVKVMKEPKKKETKETKVKEEVKSMPKFNEVKLPKTKKRLLKRKYTNAVVKLIPTFIPQIFVLKLKPKTKQTKQVIVKNISNTKLPSTPKGWRKRALKLAYTFSPRKTTQKLILANIAKLIILLQKQKQTQKSQLKYVLRFGYSFEISIPKITGN